MTLQALFIELVRNIKGHDIDPKPPTSSKTNKQNQEQEQKTALIKALCALRLCEKFVTESFLAVVSLSGQSMLGSLSEPPLFNQKWIYSEHTGGTNLYNMQIYAL